MWFMSCAVWQVHCGFQCMLCLLLCPWLVQGQPVGPGQSCLGVPGPRGGCVWEGHSSDLLALPLGSGDGMRTLAWALFFKTPPGIACSLEQAEQKAGGSILGSSGAVRIQFHIYFLSLQSMEEVNISTPWSLYHWTCKRLNNAKLLGTLGSKPHGF